MNKESIYSDPLITTPRNGLSRRGESLTYLVGWIIVAAIFLLDLLHTRSASGHSLFDKGLLTHLAAGLIPLLILFSINNFVLIPRLLMRERILGYIITLAAIILIIWGSQLMIGPMMRPVCPPPGHQHHPIRPLFTLPFFLDFIYDLLVAGTNIAVALLFQQYRRRLDNENRLKTEAEHKLSYLKAQINPHFYMNMLNNIHGMIDIDPEKAQEMVMSLSRLMRYVLYDTDRDSAPLGKEIDFLHNYLQLMRIRYPQQKVDISFTYPPPEEITGIRIPPLIYLSLVENAFKHGISYREHSFVAISLIKTASDLRFKIVNSLHSSSPAGDLSSFPPSEGGIGLTNTRERLRLIYGEEADLHAERGDKDFTIILDIRLSSLRLTSSSSPTL